MLRECKYISMSFYLAWLKRNRVFSFISLVAFEKVFRMEFSEARNFSFRFLNEHLLLILVTNQLSTTFSLSAGLTADDRCYRPQKFLSGDIKVLQCC